VAPLDVASAASTGLYNINTLDWDEQVSIQTVSYASLN
jgi:glycerol kinase